MPAGLCAEATPALESVQSLRCKIGAVQRWPIVARWPTLALRPAGRATPGYHELNVAKDTIIGLRLVPLCAPITLNNTEAQQLANGHPPERLAPFESMPQGLRVGY